MFSVVERQTVPDNVATESLWMNYPEPAQRHDLRYPGGNFRERERIKRKKARWQARLAKLDPLERAAIMACLRELEVTGSACNDDMSWF